MKDARASDFQLIYDTYQPRILRYLERPILPLPFELSDWAIFAILLFVLDVILLIRESLRIRKPIVENLG